MAKTVLITGASRGIGDATAKHFLEKGWHVVGTSTSGNDTIKDNNFKMLRLNLGDEKSITDCVEALDSQGITPYVLINNAGVNPHEDMQYLDVDTFRQTIDINLTGLVSLTEKLLPVLLPSGRVINLTSSAGDVNNKYIQVSITPYRMSKAGVNMYTHTLAKRFERSHLIAVALHPGWVRTDMGSPDAPKSTADVAEELYELSTKDIATDTLWEDKQIIKWW